MKVFVKGKGEENLDKRHFVSSGGEGSVYAKNGVAYKIYTKSSHVIPEAKMMELSKLSAPEIIKPEHMILTADNKNTPIGYTMKFVQHTAPLCQLFTKTFKDRNNIKIDDIIELIRKFRINVQHCHDKLVWIVDLNELNFLVNKDKFDTIYFIDVDSYMTRSFQASAIMDSIRDRHAKSFNDDSDWFSFGIITFQMLTGIHPYKGKHNTYKTLDERMIHNISVFNKDVSVPMTMTDPKQVIPRAYYDWYMKVFEEGYRGPFPTKPDIIIAIKTTQAPKVVAVNFEISEVCEAPDNIISYQYINGQHIILTEAGLWIESNINIKNVSGDYSVAPYAHIAVTPKYQSIITAIVKNGKVLLYDATHGKPLDFEFGSVEVFSYDNRLYVLGPLREEIYEISFNEITPVKTIVTASSVCNVLPNATQIFDGVVIQNLLGSYYVSIFPKVKTHHQINIRELDSYRIIDAKYLDGVLIVIGEKSGKYDKFIFVVNEIHDEYSIRIIQDIQYTEIIFTVLDNGVCVHVLDDETIELFFNKKNVTDIKQFKDNVLVGTQLFHKGTELLFTKDNRIFYITVKK